MRPIFAVLFLFLATWVRVESFGENFNDPAAMIKERDEELDDIILNDGDDDEMDVGENDIDEGDKDDDDEDENGDSENDTIDENVDDPMKVGMKKKCGRALRKCLRSCNKATMKCFKRAAKKCKSNEERGCAKVSYECAAEACDEKKRMKGKGKGKKKLRRCIRHFKKCLKGEGSGIEM